MQDGALNDYPPLKNVPLPPGTRVKNPEEKSFRLIDFGRAEFKDGGGDRDMEDEKWAVFNMFRKRKDRYNRNLSF